MPVPKSFEEDPPSSFEEEKEPIDYNAAFQRTATGTAPTLREDIVGMLPTIGSILGGVATGGASIPVSVAGAGLGGMMGQATKQLSDKWAGQAPPGDTLSDLTSIAKEGSLQGLMDVVGRIPGLPGELTGKSLAKRVYQGAIRPTMREASRDVVDTGFREGIPAGVNMADAVEKIKAPLNKQLDAVYADNAGKTISRDQLREEIGTNMVNRFLSLKDRMGGMSDSAFLDAVDKTLKQLDEYPKDIPIEKARRMSTYFQNQAKDQFGKLSDAETETLKEMGMGVRKKIEAADPRFAPLHSRISDLADFDKTAKRTTHTELNKDMLSALSRRALWGSVLGAATGGGSGWYHGNDPMHAGGVGAASGAIAGMLGGPALRSRLALWAGKPIAPELLPSLIKIGAWGAGNGNQ